MNGRWGDVLEVRKEKRVVDRKGRIRRDKK